MKTAIIFGASGSIGNILQEHLREIGYSLTLTSRSYVYKSEPSKLLLPCDISSVDQVDQVFIEHKKFWGIHPVVVINVAAVQGPIGNTWEISVDEWRSSFDINFHACFYITKAALSYLEKGSIIHFSGGGAVLSRPFFSAYACAKTALLRLVENVAEELALINKKILINAVAPGAIRSKMTEAVLQAKDRAGKNGLREAEETWDSGGTKPELIISLVDFLMDENKNKGFTGRLVHVRENYLDFVKNDTNELTYAQGKLRRNAL